MSKDRWGTSGKFVHLHSHDEFSTLDGINRTDRMPEYVKSMGQDALAQTNHGNLAGAYRHFNACRKAGIRPIIGIEAYYTDGEASVREKDTLGRAYYHMILLAKNNIGLQNLQHLSSRSFVEGKYHKPRIDDKMIADHSEGIFATTACLGSRISQLILNNDSLEAEKVLLRHADMFKNKFFVELQTHSGKEQQLVNKILIELAKKHNLPMIVTADCHYTHKEDKGLHEQALCMSTNKKMYMQPYDPERKASGESGKTRFSFGEIDVHASHHDHMWAQAQACGIPYEAISNTWHLSNSVDDKTYFSDVKNRYTKFQDLPEGVNSVQYLEYLTKEMLWQRMGGEVPQAYRDRIDEELKIFKYMGFSDYALVVQQIVQDGNDVGVCWGAGRGSGAGSLVLYGLGITHIDPMKYGLLFSRFLNKGRSGKPLHFNQEMIEKIKQAVPEPAHTCSSHGQHQACQP